MTATARRPRGSRRTVGLGLVVLLVIVVLALLATGGESRRSGPSLSPRSDVEDGTSGLLLLLDQLGATTRVVDAVPAGTDQRALLLRDNLTADERAAVARWVEDGGRLVVADPSSTLAAPADGPAGTGGAIERGECDVPGLDGVRTIRSAVGVGGLDLPVPVRYTAATGMTSCFGGYVVQEHRGAGTITSVGGAEPFVNQLLATGDGSTLAVDLLAPTGTEHVAVVDVVPAPGTGLVPLLEVVAPRVWGALLLGGVAYVVFAVHRGRRLGRPVLEPQRVAIPGSGLVTAVGRLQQRTGSADRAAAALRADTRRAVVGRVGLPANAPPETIAQVVAARTGLDAARVVAALDDTTVTDEAGLVALTQDLDAIRQEVMHVRR